MRVASLVAALCAVAAVDARPRIARIHIQPVEASATAATPIPFAEISYDMTTLSLSSFLSYEPPELPETAKLMRIGLYDSGSRQWLAGTTVASAENFSKGYSPHLLLLLDSQGGVVSVSCKGIAIDAGHTRDFGPKLVVLPEARGAQPQLSKPVVLSPEGNRVEPEQEKTFLQKYWWMIGIAVLVAMSGGGGGER
ncbi:cyclin-dependent protein kinase regulator pho80 [Ophiocordyceps camponoti-floridani]|uniref:Cyclin-dependent protein kinase regulator pho80 n=1 Tax=Ophiocordyceps camponoti-floridani TaxID=2030778 RepID=A0A8H4QCA6_9HYPO|nr:cyclin-dependent protein kinase regulator pho80 [Ophiocordyceps camponoti-floridani]